MSFPLSTSLPRNFDTATVYTIDADGGFSFSEQFEDTPVHGEFALDYSVGLSDVDQAADGSGEIWEIDFDGHRRWFPADEAREILRTYGQEVA